MVDQWTSGPVGGASAVLVTSVAAGLGSRGAVGVLVVCHANKRR